MSNLAPKQKRSEVTQTKLLASLNALLEKKYFEHISINEVAEGADVSVGTFYRRFKDKNALLPLLYEELGLKLSDWIASLQQQKFTQQQDAIEYLCSEMQLFISQRKGVFRTLHLYTRLHADLLPQEKLIERSESFTPIIQWLCEQLFGNEISAKQKEKVQMWVFIIISTLLERTLYANVTPTIVCPMDHNQYQTNLASTIYNDIKDLL